MARKAKWKPRLPKTTSDSHDPSDLFDTLGIESDPALSTSTGHVLTLDVETPAGHPRCGLIGERERLEGLVARDVGRHPGREVGCDKGDDASSFVDDDCGGMEGGRNAR